MAFGFWAQGLGFGFGVILVMVTAQRLREPGKYY